MRKLRGKQIIILTAAAVFFALAAVFVYLKQIRVKMVSEAGLVAGIVVDREEKYFNLYGEFAALEELPKSEALGISLEKNRYFKIMRIEVIEDTLMMYATVPSGFFKGTELYVRYDKYGGVTEYKIKEKTKIPLPRS